MIAAELAEEDQRVLRAMRPDELTETLGWRLRITLPEGIPGPTND